MENLPTPTPIPDPPLPDRAERRASIQLAIFSGIGMLGLVIRAAVLVAFTGMSLVGAGQAAGPEFAATILDASSMLFCALLLVPALVYSLRRLKGREVRPLAIPPVRAGALALLVAAWVAALVLWTVLTLLFDFGWAVAAPFFLLGVALPVAGLTWIGIGGLTSGSRRRLWATLALGMVGGVGLAIVAEYLVFLLVGLAGGVAMLANPELAALVEELGRQIENAGDIQAMMVILAPYLTNPLVFLALLSFVAGIGPVIEEIAKPLAVLVLGKRLHTPAEGFALGALCGAGFALLEGLMAASGTVEMWGLGLLGRAVSSLMHITASGLMGWGYASARLEKRYGRLLLLFLLAVAIHGLWNGSALTAVYGALLTVADPARPNPLGLLVMLAGLGTLALMLPTMLAALPLLNRRLQPAASPAPGTPVPPVPDPLPPAPEATPPMRP